MSRRIVACQGPIQLVTAVAVLRQRDQETGQRGLNAHWDDHLAIMELASPEGQRPAFVTALARMANTLRKWHSIIDMCDANPSQFRRSDSPLGLALRLDDTSAAGVDEVFVVREWQTGNQALLRSFPEATKICFGDSIGIYLPPVHMAPREPLARRAARYMRSLATLRARKGPAAEPARVSADCYYLTLPEAFGQPPSTDVRTTEIAHIWKVLDDLRPLLPKVLVEELYDRMNGGRVTVLMTSNFSEQGLMSPKAELAAYVAYLADQRLDTDSLLLIKPHPRDRVDKVSALAQILGRRFRSVYTLTDELGFYLPLEVLLMEIQSSAERHAGMDVCTFSSACLASQHVLGIIPRLGFGERIVGRHFRKQFVAPRQHHERELRAACKLGEGRPT